MTSRNFRKGAIQVPALLVLLGLTVLVFQHGSDPADGTPPPRRTPVTAAQLQAQARKPSKDGKEQKPAQVFQHPHGRRTESRELRNSNTMRQDTYDADNRLAEIRTFQLDGKGRPRSAVIYDGRKNAEGSTRYFYDPKTNQMVMEELFHKNGKLARRLYYPGALKDPKYAKRAVAFSFDPDRQDAPCLPSPNAGVEIKTQVKPIVPVDQDGGEFGTLREIRLALADLTR